MAIRINLDKILSERGMKSKELAEIIGITQANLSILRSGKAKAVRFSTLDAICKELECQPGDLLVYSNDQPLIQTKEIPLVETKEIYPEYQYLKASKDDELNQILTLQKANLEYNISSETKQKEGFVTVQHDLDLLRNMNAICPHTIAKDGEKVIGYALSMDASFETEVEVLQPMFAEMRQHPATSKIKNFLVMGQICIDKEHRGKGVFRGLYNFMKNQHLPQYSSIVTEIDAINKRSLDAHYAIGFKRLLQYESNGKTWVVVQLS